MTTRRRPALAGGVLVLGFTLAGCGGGDAAANPCETLGEAAAALAGAKAAFDEAPSVDLTLSTDSVPKSGNAILGAEGTLTQQPAFEGSATIFLGGGAQEISVTSVDGKVIASFLGEIDPASYSAPDPAEFADPESGISALLPQLTDVAGCEGRRDGNDTLAEYSGSLAGDLLAPIIPSASATSSYRSTVGLRPDGTLATLEVTGSFFDAGGDDVTYDLTFAPGGDVTISAP